jgi:hypothetical protein
MSIYTNPAYARTDVAARPADTPPPAGVAPADALTDPAVRRAGRMVAAGALIWAGTTAAVGNTPDWSVGIAISDFGALPFQLGLFALVAAQLKTQATGVTRFARGMLRVEFGLLALATLWTVLHGGVPALRDDLWLAILDVFWPLSMLGMAVIGVKIAFAGRWRGAARVWPVVAESWAPVTVPAFVIGGPTVGQWVGVTHLVLGYTVLGLILALRPALTRR